MYAARSTLLVSTSYCVQAAEHPADDIVPLPAAAPATTALSASTYEQQQHQSVLTAAHAARMEGMQTEQAVLRSRNRALEAEVALARVAMEVSIGEGAASG